MKRHDSCGGEIRYGHPERGHGLHHPIRIKRPQFGKDLIHEEIDIDYFRQAVRVEKASVGKKPVISVDFAISQTG